MKFLKKIISSTPVVLILFLSVFFLGLILLTSGIFIILSFIEITITIVYLILMVFMILEYKRKRQPIIIYYSHSSESEKLLNDQLARIWKEEYLYVRIFTILISISTVINYWYGFILAPIVLVINSAFFLIVLSLIEKGSVDISESNLAVSHLPGEPKVKFFSKTAINYFVILLLVAGYWTFQIQKNESQIKQDGYSILNELNDLKYCQNYQAGCVQVGSITNITFKKIKATSEPGKSWQLCFKLNYEYSKFGNTYLSDYRFVDYCFDNDTYNKGWSISQIEDEIYSNLKEEVNRL